MEKLPSYALLRLEHLALQRIAVALYSEPRILALLAKKDSCTAICCIDMIRGPVGDKVSKLYLPQSLTKQLGPLIIAVRNELIAWKESHEEYIGYSESTQVACLQKVRWTSVGTVDRRRTAEELVRCDVLDISKRFELALLYCLEDEIPLLFEQLPEEDKTTFCKSRIETPHLDLFLPYILGKEFGLPDSEMTTFFEKSVLCGNKTLAAFCFEKLTKEEREACLVQTIKKVIRHGFRAYDSYWRERKFSDVVCYLLSLITPEEQMGIFKELPLQIFSCFLNSPWQDICLDILDIIPESQYYSLMSTVDSSIFHSGYYLPNLVQNLFLRSPIEFRKRFVDDDDHLPYGFFCYFFQYSDIETVRLIFRTLDAADRVKLMCSESGLQIIYRWTSRWYLLEVYLRAATLSKESKQKLKESFIDYYMTKQKIKDDDACLRTNYRRFFEFCEQTEADWKQEKRGK